MNKKDAKKLADQARAQGWTIQPTKNGHEWWLAPNGERILKSGSASDHRALKNHLALIRRAGFAA